MRRGKLKKTTAYAEMIEMAIFPMAMTSAMIRLFISNVLTGVADVDAAEATRNTADDNRGDEHNEAETRVDGVDAWLDDQQGPDLGEDAR